VREYRKSKLDNISRWLERFIYSSKRSGAWEIRSADEWRCWKGSQSMDQLDKVEKKDFRRASSLTACKNVISRYF